MTFREYLVVSNIT